MVGCLPTLVKLWVGLIRRAGVVAGAYCWGKDGRDEPAEQSRKPIKSNLCMTYYSPISNLSILNRRAQHDEMADASLGI